MLVNRLYRPASISIDAGTTVTWRNIDDRPHTVTARDRSFDSGIFDTGTLLAGDLASAEADGPSGGFWEFEFDESGRAVRLVGRAKQDDRVLLTATRAGEGGTGR